MNMYAKKLMEQQKLILSERLLILNLLGKG